MDGTPGDDTGSGTARPAAWLDAVSESAASNQLTSVESAALHAIDWHAARATGDRESLGAPTRGRRPKPVIRGPIPPAAQRNRTA